MTIRTLSAVPASELLTVEAQRELLTAAQDVPVEVIAEEDGERCVYGKTPASEAAIERLTTAFIGALHSAAKTAKTLDPDEAFALVTAEFVEAIRRHDLDSDVPFSATIKVILIRAISDADRTSDIITVRENVAARYWRLLHKHGFDVNAAYEECRTTTNGFEPSTFLAVHRAIGSMTSLDGFSQDDNGDSYKEFQPSETIWASSQTPEDIVVQAELVRQLLALTTDRQQQILRLYYGFADVVTENLRYAAGFRTGEELSDDGVSVAMNEAGLGRQTVNRERRASIRVMRDAVQDAVDEG